MIVLRMEVDSLERIIQKIRDKYEFEMEEPLLTKIKLTYMLWKIKAMIWNEIGKEINEDLTCNMALYIDLLFDEIPSISDEWLNYLIFFNSECIKYINDKKIIEMLVDMLIVRNIYYELNYELKKIS